MPPSSPQGRTGRPRSQELQQGLSADYQSGAVSRLDRLRSADLAAAATNYSGALRDVDGAAARPTLHGRLGSRAERGQRPAGSDRGSMGRRRSGAPGGEQTHIRGEPAAVRLLSAGVIRPFTEGPSCRPGRVHGGRFAHCAGGGTSNGAEPAATSTPLWRGGRDVCFCGRFRGQSGHGSLHCKCRPKRTLADLHVRPSSVLR